MASVSGIAPVKLTAIGQSGVPDEPIAVLSDMARDVCVATAQLYGRIGFVLPWIGYLGTLNGQMVGTCAFKGGEVTINSDGTFTQQSGNSGTWECVDASKRTVRLKWKKGGM